MRQGAKEAGSLTSCWLPPRGLPTQHEQSRTKQPTGQGLRSQELDRSDSSAGALTLTPSAHRYSYCGPALMTGQRCTWVEGWGREQ